MLNSKRSPLLFTAALALLLVGAGCNSDSGDYAKKPTTAQAEVKTDVNTGVVTNTEPKGEGDAAIDSSVDAILKAGEAEVSADATESEAESVNADKASLDAMTQSNYALEERQ